MKFALTILCPPHSDSALRALRFAQASIHQGHNLNQLFFYQDGVYHANALARPPQDEINMAAQWKQLQTEHQVGLYVCVASAIRRGIINKAEAERLAMDNGNLADGFEIVGLGQLMTAKRENDRVLTFG